MRLRQTTLDLVGYCCLLRVLRKAYPLPTYDYLLGRVVQMGYGELESPSLLQKQPAQAVLECLGLPDRKTTHRLV